MVGYKAIFNWVCCGGCVGVGEIGWVCFGWCVRMSNLVLCIIVCMLVLVSDGMIPLVDELHRVMCI